MPHLGRTPHSLDPLHSPTVPTHSFRFVLEFCPRITYPSTTEISTHQDPSTTEVEVYSCRKRRLTERVELELRIVIVGSPPHQRHQLFHHGCTRHLLLRYDNCHRRNQLQPLQHLPVQSLLPFRYSSAVAVAVAIGDRESRTQLQSLSLESSDSSEFHWRVEMEQRVGPR
ncbi:hypothetical protein RHSIM_Rhsim01G0029100 [Rhododendron simsii]|uniref:Uncharacterized protein n=1 Tax=Rhododendron simsii TaxID=118357 RepID=A0A834LZ82_RHOSS|nr:hypothetical protein RHSIM_Rhsim01G0029100 [Rhododendron simsii]